MSNIKSTHKAIKAAAPTVKRAVIYVRSATEQRTGPTSAHEQEQICQEYCKQRGYVVVDVYQDTACYRVGEKLVGPSGARVDRPQFRRMLSDASTSAFDVIVALREDRLYRSMRPMRDMLNCLTETGVTLELVQGVFDSNSVSVKGVGSPNGVECNQTTACRRASGKHEKGKTKWLTSSQLRKRQSWQSNLHASAGIRGS